LPERNKAYEEVERWVLTNIGAYPVWEDVGAELDDRKGEIGQQETTHVAHETLSVQIPQLGEKGVDDQGDSHEDRGEKHPDGEHGELERVHHGFSSVGIREAEQRQNRVSFCNLPIKKTNC